MRCFRSRLLVLFAGFCVGSGANIPQSAAGHAQARSADSVEEQGVLDPTLAQATFDSVWNRVLNTHYDPELGGLDWEAVRAEMRPQVGRASSALELRTILTQMLGRLGESHFAIIPGSLAQAFEPSTQPVATGDAEPGIDVRWIGGSLVVTQVRGGSPAERAGVQRGWTVESVGDMPVDTLVQWIREAAAPGREERDLATWLPSGVRGRLRGVDGTSASLSVRDHLDRLKRLAIPRAVPSGELVRFGNLPPLRIEIDHYLERLDSASKSGLSA